ncbi:MAG: hypothetical protein HYV09_12320 [Deltaproteobacteria bacterium]|nr:hypothetical protein [Deltaproteobacteria bacterium]
MTPASKQALERLRDPSTLEWYAIPLLALLFYVYALEIKSARRTGKWEPIVAGLTLFGMDFVNETINGWILVLSQRSALWTAPGKTALRTMVGWNLEIMFMFAIAGVIFFHTLSEDRDAKILGLPDRWFWAIAYSAFCVAVEWVLNVGGLLVWEYPFWNRSFAGVWLIFLFGYFHFYVATILVLGLSTTRKRVVAIASIWSIAIAMNVVGMGVLGWRY